MMFKRSPSRSRQSGFTLLEMLLAVGIIGVVLIGISRVITELTEQKLAQAAGQQISRISTIAEDVAMKNFKTIFGNTTSSVSNANPTATDLPGDILAMLQNNNFPINESSFRIANSPVEVLIGNEGTAGSDSLITRIVVILENPMPLVRATKIARAIGGRGGIIRSDYAGEIRSAFGNWAYTPKDGMLSLLSRLMNPPAGYAYVAAHITYSEYDRIGPYLSRIDSGYGENVMQQDIIMNGFSVVGAKDIDVGTLTATRAASFDQLAVSGQANFNGGLDVNNKFNIAGDLAVNEGNLTVSSADLRVPGGNITARGLRADILEAEDLTTKDLYTETLNVEGGNTFIASNVTISGGATLDITGTLKASVVDADEINTSTIMTDSLEVDGNTTLNGTTTINNTVSIDQLILDGCMQMDGKDYGTCN
jgi:prepilin-type N-terminal cleavage/methylation domain-containing protein